MKFSLIIGTYKRLTELDNLLSSLSIQSYKNFEVIICDQNPEGFLDYLIEKYKNSLSLIHIKTERGISRARNEGLRIFNGDIVAFPDDDCYYQPDLLENVRNYFLEFDEIDGISVKIKSSDGGSYEQNFLHISCTITKQNVFSTVSSFSLFLRRRVIERVGFFDVKLGVGSGTPLGSGEEIDYILRALNSGFNFNYVPYFFVYHPSKDPAISGYSKADRERTRSYNRGYAYLLKKYRYPLKYLIRAFFRPLGGAFLALVRFEFRRFIYQIFKFYGRLEIFLRRLPPKIV